MNKTTKYLWGLLVVVVVAFAVFQVQNDKIEIIEADESDGTPSVWSHADSVSEEQQDASWKNGYPLRWNNKKTTLSASQRKEPPWRIGVSNYSLANIWREQMFKELQAAAELRPDIAELIVTNADGDVEKQIRDIVMLIDKGIDALLITPLNPKRIAQVVEKAYERGIVIVIFNDLIDTEKFHSLLWTNQYKFGQIGGKWLNERLNGRGNVVLLNGIPGTTTSTQRAEGAKSMFGPDIVILQEVFVNWDHYKSKEEMARLLKAFPKIDGVYSQGASQGAISAFEEAGRPLVPITGEGNNGYLKYWKKHQENGFSSIAPTEISWQSVLALEQACALLSGKTVNKWEEIEMPITTDENIDEFVKPDLPDYVAVHPYLSDIIIEKVYGIKSNH